jgi:hypothetical protein
MNKFITICICFFSLYAISQNKPTSLSEHLETRQGKFFLQGLIEYRITPYYNDDRTFSSVRAANVNHDKMNSGTAAGYNLKYFASKNFAINFGQTFRYTTFIFTNDTPQFFSDTPAAKVFLIDYNFSADYYLKVFKKGEFVFRLGLSFMNSGSDYSSTNASYDSNQQLIGWNTGQYDFTLFTQNLGLGYRKDKLEIMLGVYHANLTNYDIEASGGIYYPYLKLEYSLLKF